MIVPAFSDVTNPELDTLAVELSGLLHIPPDVGASCVVELIHIFWGPVIETVGSAFTIIVPVSCSIGAVGQI